MESNFLRLTSFTHANVLKYIQSMHVSIVYSFILLRSVPLHRYTIVGFSLHPVKDSWVISCLGKLQRRLL